MIIGLTGFAGVGKDTIGAELVRRGFERLSFAESLKELARKCNPIVEFEDGGVFTRLNEYVEVHGWEKAKFDVYDVRRFLQALGVGARELFGPDFWVNQVRDKVEFDPINGMVGNYVVTDVRFQNEAKMIKGYGQGYMVQIVRPGIGPVNDHESERPIPHEMIDIAVSNFGSLHEIPTIVDWILSDIELIKIEKAAAARLGVIFDNAALQHQAAVEKMRRDALAKGFQEIGTDETGEFPVFIKPIDDEVDEAIAGLDLTDQYGANLTEHRRQLRIKQEREGGS